jgi:sulfur-oxidizing protein SoxX
MMPGGRHSRRVRVAYRCIAAAAVAAVLSGVSLAVAAAADTGSPRLAAFEVLGDGIPHAIGGATGDADRGRTLILRRESANCLVCHALPDPGVRFSGNVGPSLGGVARTLSVAQLRLRVVDIMRINPGTVMPSYYRTDGFDRVAAAYRGRPILDANQVEDIVAYLATLK